MNSKQRTAKKNGVELQGPEQQEFDRVTRDTNEMQRTIEKLRKQSKSHTNIINDYRAKKQKAMGAAGPQVPTASPGSNPAPQGGQPVGVQTPMTPSNTIPGNGTPQPGQLPQLTPGAQIQTQIGQLTPNQPIPMKQPQQLRPQIQQGMMMANRMPGQTQQQGMPMQVGGMVQQQPQQQRMQMMTTQQGQQLGGMEQQGMMVQQQTMQTMQIPAHEMNRINQMPPQQKMAVMQQIQQKHLRLQQQQQQMNPQQMAMMQQQRMRAQQMGQQTTTVMHQPQQQQQQHMVMTRMQGNPGEGPMQQLQQQVRMQGQPSGGVGQFQVQMQGIQHGGQMATVSVAGIPGQMMQQRPLVQMQQQAVGQIQAPQPNPMIQGQQPVPNTSFPQQGQQIAMVQQQQLQTFLHIYN